MKPFILFLMCALSLSCARNNYSTIDNVNPILIHYLGPSRVEIISMATSVRPVIVSDSNIADDPRSKAGPFVVTEIMPQVSQKMSEQIKSMVLDVNIYGNQRQYLYASKEVAESRMVYDLCIFEPKYAIEFKYQNRINYFFVSTTCEKIAHSYFGDFIYEDIYDGARFDVNNMIKKIFTDEDRELKGPE